MTLALSTVNLQHIEKFKTVSKIVNIHIKLHRLGNISIKTLAIQKGGQISKE
jgi:hypothetical protein